MLLTREAYRTSQLFSLHPHGTATDKAARAVTIYTLVGNVRRLTVKIREHTWAVTTVTMFALNKINVKR